eukprot:Selendium_serpulae@DN3458_c0_g1_i2.p1
MSGTTPVATVVEGKSAVLLDFADSKSDKKLEVPVTFARTEDEGRFKTMVSSSAFQSWAEQYRTSKLTLETIAVQRVEMVNEDVESIDLKLGVQKDSKPVDGDVHLVKPKVAVLVMLRDVDKKRDFVLFTAKPRASLGEAEHYEIPAGTLDAEGNFVSEHSELIKKQCGLSLNVSEMTDLSSIVFGKSKGIACPSSPSWSEKYQIYLYRKNLSPEAIEKIIETISGKSTEKTAEGEEPDASAGTDAVISSQPHETIFKLLKLGEAWRMVSDMRSMSAIFMVMELRYHYMMPKFRGPSQSPEGKSKASFETIAALTPASKGLNLIVRVHKKAEGVSEPIKADGSRIKEGFVSVIGDSTGTIKMKVTNDQLQKFQNEGEVLVIRNAKVEIDKGRMYLAVDRWGKIGDAESLEQGQEPCQTVNTETEMSEIDHEIVAMADRHVRPADNDESRPRGRGRGRGRSGARGQGGPRGARRYQMAY